MNKPGPPVFYPQDLWGMGRATRYCRAANGMEHERTLANHSASDELLPGRN